MLKTEYRPRSSSFTVAQGRCRHPGLLPVGLAEAEALLRAAPLKEAAEDSDAGEEAGLAELVRPELPAARDERQREKVTRQFVLCNLTAN